MSDDRTRSTRRTRRIRTREVLVYLEEGEGAFLEELRREGLFESDELEPEQADDLRLAKILMQEMGVNAAGVVHTLLKHKLVATAGRKKVVGKPMQYKTTRDFLVQFGLDNLAELPNLKELEELSRAALGEDAGDELQPSLLGVDEAQGADADEAEFVDQPDGAEGEQE